MTDTPVPQDHTEDEAFNYEETLRYSQRIRRQVVTQFMPDGRVPNDPDNVKIILSTLKDMDNTALNDRKNNIDQAAADTSKTVAESMQQFVAMQMNRNPFERQPDGTVPAVPQVDVEKLGDHRLVEGEQEIGVIEETSGDFMRRMEIDSEDDDE